MFIFNINIDNKKNAGQTNRMFIKVEISLIIYPKNYNYNRK